MSEGNAGPEGGGFAGFSEGLLIHLESFRRHYEVEPRVMITLWNQETYVFETIAIDLLANVPGCILIRGTCSGSLFGLVVREEHIYRVEFEPDPTRVAKIGF